MAQKGKGKGSLIRIVVLLVILAAAVGGYFYMQQMKSSLNSVEKIETYVANGNLVGKSLDDAKAALGHDNPTPKAGEESVYLFDMTEKDPQLTVVVEVVVRGGVVARNQTHAVDATQTGTGG